MYIIHIILQLVGLAILTKILNYVEYFYRMIYNTTKLNNFLETENLYIITNDFCKCKNLEIYNYTLFTYKCNSCRIKRIIDFEKEKQVYQLLSNIKNKVKFIIHTHGGESELPNFLTYILKQNKIYVETYIPQIALSAGTFIALSSNVIYMNWYSAMGPIDTQLSYSESVDEDYEETFPAKFIKTIKTKENALTKLQSLEADSVHNDDLFILNKVFKTKKCNKIIKNLLESNRSHSIRYGPKDLETFGLNIKIGILDDIQEMFDIFLSINK
jgi:ATP-dependent protease ClpP protease subunit